MSALSRQRRRTSFTRLRLAMLGLAAWPGFATDQLYLLAGTAPQSKMDLPVRLYRLDAPASSLKLVREVAGGMSCVLEDDEKRRLIVASPGLEARDFNLIDMTNPGKVVTRHAEYDTRELVPGSIYLLDLPDNKSGIALALGRVTPADGVQFPSDLQMVSLDAPGPTISVPFDKLRYVRVAGEVGGGITMFELRVILRGDPLRVTVGKPNAASDTGMSRPPYLRERDPREGYMLIANDAKRAVMSPAEPGVLDVLDKTSGEWRRIPIPFPEARIRAFGPWLAMIEVRSSEVTRPSGPVARKGEVKVAHESPGAEKRRSEQIGPPYRLEPGLTVDDVFQELQLGGASFPGELLLYNLDTGIQLKISTGVGDSEIVLVTDSAVYYRVDDVLYLRHISGSSLSEPVRLASGSEVVQVHWAFLN